MLPHSWQQQREMAEEAKPAMIIAIDDSDHSFYAMQWTLGHFFPAGAAAQFSLVVVHAKPIPTPVIAPPGPVGVGAAAVVDVFPYLDSNLKRIAAKVIQTAKELCAANSLTDVTYEVVEGDARDVLCEAVEKHEAHILVLGSHGYGAIKRAVLGSVSDYCAHHAHCTVMIVKKPKEKNHPTPPTN